MKPSPTSWTFHRPTTTETSTQYPHTLYRVTLKDTSTWALDLTSAQYGYEDTLSPWPEYAHTRIRQIVSVDVFGSASNMDLAGMFGDEMAGALRVIEDIGKAMGRGVKAEIERRYGSARKLLVTQMGADGDGDGDGELAGRAQELADAGVEELKLCRTSEAGRILARTGVRIL